MVKVNVGTMSAQASSVSAIVSQRVSALTDAKQSLSSFASQDQLKGAAYQNAKAYATSVLGPLIDGMILLSEETEKGVTKLQTLYAEKCGSESLDSEVLTDKIEKDQELLIKIQDLQAHLEKHASFLSHALDGLEATVKARLRKNKKKLKNLMEFNAESSSVFEALAEFQDSVSAGLSFVSTGFNNFNGTFDTSGKGLEWTKTIQTGMKKREDAKAEELKKKKDEESKKVRVNINNNEVSYENLYNEFKNIMGSDTASRISQVFALLPGNFSKKVLKSDGLWEILANMESKGVSGKKSADAILNFLAKYEGYSNFGKYTTKAKTYLENLANPLKAGVKFGLEKISGYKNLSEMVLKGGGKAETTGKFLGKSVKIIGKGATVLTIADISITGLSKGIEEYSKTKDIGKAAKKGALSAVASVGPLEGATLGAAVGGVPGAIIGGGIGLAIQGVKAIDPKFFDHPVKSSQKIADNIGKSVNEVKNSVSKYIGGFGKVIGFG